MSNHIIDQAERRAARRDKKKHPKMKVSGVGTKKLAQQLTKKA
ncbi:MAG: hypothetical protein AAB429_02280 [Patescibacteria group bacterium]